jgi:UDP-N-acetylglucosamine 1-carboxyvinyltransferase
VLDIKLIKYKVLQTYINNFKLHNKISTISYTIVNKVKIYGGSSLQGAVTIGGAKNSALPILAASLLSDKKVSIGNVPDIADTRIMLEILKGCGAKYIIKDKSVTESIRSRGRVITIDSSNINELCAPYELVTKMRASILVLGPLLARFGKAKVALPGGCAIGPRPINIHLEALKQMGAEIELDGDYLIASAPNGLKGNEITFEKPSVGATENIAMAASISSGTTVINNAAREPEVVDLLRFLCGMGAEIEGIGTSRLEIVGKPYLNGENYIHTVIGDRIETATYAIAACLTSGKVELHGIEHKLMDDVWGSLSAAGVSMKVLDDHSIEVSASLSGIRPIDIITAPYPGFPTDVQAQIMALLMHAKGTSTITETIYTNRFMHVVELNKMGACISIDCATATIKGGSQIKSADVTATDLRASAALVLAALSAQDGESFVINDIHHLERGYDSMFHKLSKCGAKIELYHDDAFQNIEHIKASNVV